MRAYEAIVRFRIESDGEHPLTPHDLGHPPTPTNEEGFSIYVKQMMEIPQVEADFDSWYVNEAQCLSFTELGAAEDL